MPGGIPEQPEGDVISHNATLMEGRVQQNKLIVRQFISNAVLMPQAHALAALEPAQVMLNTGDGLTGYVTEMHFGTRPASKHRQTEHTVSACQIQNPPTPGYLVNGLGNQRQQFPGADIQLFS